MFDREDYARDVMSNSRFDKGALVVDAPGSLRFLQSLHGLQDLEIRTDATLDVAGLAKAPSLTSLNITRAPGLQDLTGLAGLRQLTTLRLGQAPDLNSLDGVENLQLQRLHIDDAPQLESLADLERARGSLLDLRVRRAPLSDINPLVRHPHLALLVLQLGYIETLEPLEDLDVLKEIELTGAQNDLDFHWLTVASGLQSVRLTNYAGGLAFTPFGVGGRTLRRLSIENCVAGSSVQALGDIGQVRELSLIKLPLQSLAGLRRVVGDALAHLTIIDSPISVLGTVPASVDRLTLRGIAECDLSPLARLPHLIELNLAQLPAVDFDDLRGCEKLEFITLGPIQRICNLRALLKMPSAPRIDPGPHRGLLEELGYSAILPSPTITFSTSRPLTLARP